MTASGIALIVRSRIVRSSLLALAVVANASNLEAQAQTPARGCPGGNGINISVTSGDSSGGVNRIIDQSRPLDTTIVFDIAERTWTRTNLAAAISVGLADEARGGYMICAGVTALMPSATLTVRGARGRVHFQASLTELTSAIRSAPGAVSPQPRRL